MVKVILETVKNKQTCFMVKVILETVKNKQTCLTLNSFMYIYVILSNKTEGSLGRAEGRQQRARGAARPSIYG